MTTNADMGGREREALEADLEKLLVTLMGSNELIEGPAQDFIAQNPSQDQSFRSYEYRLTVIEQRYRKRLSGLNGLLGQLQSTSSFLSRQLKELPLSHANADPIKRGAAPRKMRTGNKTF
ncbi:MAG: hypothetical protein ACREVK_00760 [Gammaproteobacteria bacterium]